MRLFATLVILGFRRWSTYRLATAAGAFTNTVFGLIKASITVGAIGAAGGTLAGYDALAGATYAWVVQALVAPVNVFQWNELALRIRDGDIAVDLARPLDPQFAYLAGFLGRAIHQFIPRGAPPLLAGALVTGLALPTTPLPYLLGLVSVVLGVSVSFASWWLVNLAAFWLIELRGLLTLHIVGMSVLSGLVIPVHWFPDRLATLAALTPFPSILQAPVDVITGRAEGTAALGVLAVQAAWLAGVLLLGRLVFARGARKLVVQGG
ncbi:ABC transporter permease [Jiangella aurantiaca]|uniref:ABC transporter permease n=1 Tax=Jiangella aurantiaca TaxID=2530373 RepID=A0A4R5A057_9ACTN|nr:ABC-2 family transporter protein [Jiangella aurantiaca]TDD65061.1 ABC transporter permease [Jiangella aurantiaca]